MGVFCDFPSENSIISRKPTFDFSDISGKSKKILLITQKSFLMVPNGFNKSIFVTYTLINWKNLKKLPFVEIEFSKIIFKFPSSTCAAARLSPSK